LAAADGTVIAAAYSSSMGNYVMIDHGSGLFTIYMHASALYVSQGQSVTAGTQIAAVGSTGNSTGPHLHFSVRSNGQYVSPWQYLGS
jgi:murein DD-endopeptidase MepM/ murein hydrolase activator NlpD